MLNILITTLGVILFVMNIVILFVMNIVIVGLMIKQLSGQNVESKIVTIGLIITLLVMTSFVVFMPYFMELI